MPGLTVLNLGSGSGGTVTDAFEDKFIGGILCLSQLQQFTLRYDCTNRILQVWFTILHFIWLFYYFDGQKPAAINIINSFYLYYLWVQVVKLQIKTFVFFLCDQPKSPLHCKILRFCLRPVGRHYCYLILSDVLKLMTRPWSLYWDLTSSDLWTFSIPASVLKERQRYWKLSGL